MLGLAMIDGGYLYKREMSAASLFGESPSIEFDGTRYACGETGHLPYLGPGGRFLVEAMAPKARGAFTIQRRGKPAGWARPETF